MAFPPTGFIAGAMDFVVVGAAERHGELVADLAADSARLGKAKVMGVGRAAATDDAGLLADMAEVIVAASAPWFAEGEVGLVDAGRSGGRG